MNISLYDNVLYLVLILIFIIAIIIKYLCLYVYKCDKEYNKKNIHNVYW